MSASFYELLKFAKTGIASPDMTAYDKLKALSMCKAGFPVKTISGVPPLPFKSDGTPLISVDVLGNARQTGTPSPQNIIMPDLVGVRTGNLLFSDITARNTPANTVIDQTAGSAEFVVSRNATESDASTAANISLPLRAGTYTLSMDGMSVFERNLDRIFLRDADGNVVVNNVQTGIPQTFTLDNDVVINRLSFVFAARSTYTNQVVRVMLNTGDTALPYEPYGYKIPFTTSQTVPVYLGQTQTVRRIKKLVLTANLDIQKGNSDPTDYNYYFRFSSNSLPAAAAGETSVIRAIVTHLKYGYYVAGTGAVSGNGLIVYLNFGADIMNAQPSGNTLDGLKEYLSQQYAAGTPVTIWYVLATPETGIVNEPLAKIGDYADELHSTDAGVIIPTAKGQNTLTIDTDLPPSSVSITGHIK